MVFKYPFQAFHDSVSSRGWVWEMCPSYSKYDIAEELDEGTSLRLEYISEGLGVGNASLLFGIRHKWLD